MALARAIVREPRAYLMDEPLSNLDARLRVQMRGELKRLQHQLGTTTIYVTHDQAEAMTLASRVAVMKKGRLQQFDTPMNIYNHPANRFVAEFVGSPSMNFIETTSHLTIGIRPEHIQVLTRATGRRDPCDCLRHGVNGKRDFRFSFSRSQQINCSRACGLSR